MKGKVVKIVEQRMFGFIKGDDGSEYFFHRDDFNGHFDDLVQDLNAEHVPVPVTFDPNRSPKGLRASNIARVSPIEMD